jgi:hypothetical protein
MFMAPASMHRRTVGFESLPGHCCSIKDAAHFTLLLFHMFFNITPRTSDAVAFMQVSPILGVVLVEFASGHAYEYTNVSRRAIANLLLNPNMSLGFWVNQNCIRPERTQRLDLNFYTTDGENRGAAGFIAG